MKQNEYIGFQQYIQNNFGEVSNFAIFLVSPYYLDSQLLKFFCKKLNKELPKEYLWTIAQIHNNPLLIRVIEVSICLIFY